MLCGRHARPGILLPDIRDFQLALGYRALVIQNLRPLILRPRQSLVINSFEIGTEGVGDVGALHLHEQLALLDVGAKLRVDRNHTAGSQGDNRDGPGNVGIHRAGNVQRGGGRILRGRRDRKSLGPIDGDEVDTTLTFDLHRRGRLRCLILLLAVATTQPTHAQSRCDDRPILHE